MRKKIKKKISIKIKVIVTVVSVILFFGAFATVGTFYFSKENLIESKKQDLISNNKSHASEIDQVFVHSKRLIKTISYQSQIIDFFSNNDFDDAAQDGTLFDSVRTTLESYNLDSMYASIYILDNTGLTLVSTDRSFEGHNYSFRNYFIGALQGEPQVDVAVGATSGELGYYFSYPVFDQDQNVIGVVVAKLEPDLVNQVVQGYDGIRVPDSGDVMLVDIHGVILSSSRKSRVLKSLFPLSEASKEEITKTKRYPDVNSIDYLEYTPVRESIHNYRGPEFIEMFDQRDKRTEVLIVSRVNENLYFVVREENYDDVVKGALESAEFVSIFVLSAASVAGLFTWFLISRFLRPLDEVKIQAENITNGLYEESKVVKSGDELQEISRILDKMAQKTRESEKELNRQVQQKTKELQEKLEELEKINKAMVGRELKMIELKKQIKENVSKK